MAHLLAEEECWVRPCLVHQEVESIQEEGSIHLDVEVLSIHLDVGVSSIHLAEEVGSIHLDVGVGSNLPA